MSTGNLKPYESRDEVSKIFIRRSNSASTKSSAKHRLVWNSSVEVLESYPQHPLQVSLSSFSVEHCGVWALIVGEGRDMLIVHHYVQIYESLYVAERRNRVAEGGHGANASRSMELFRSWLGLESSQIDCEVVIALLGQWVLLLQSFGAEQIGHTMLPTIIFAHACVEVKFMSIPVSCLSSGNKAGGGFGDEQCLVVLWTPNEDFGCITSRAQSTAATCATGEVKSDVVHLIMVCWVFLLQLFGAAQIGHTKWTKSICAHACVENKPISIPF